jgi:hypothetical protein
MQEHPFLNLDWFSSKILPLLFVGVSLMSLCIFYILYSGG